MLSIHLCSSGLSFTDQSNIICMVMDLLTVKPHMKVWALFSYTANAILWLFYVTQSRDQAACRFVQAHPVVELQYMHVLVGRGCSYSLTCLTPKQDFNSKKILDISDY